MRSAVFAGGARGGDPLNHQRGEPDSITIFAGRTVTVGLRAEP